MIYRFEAEASLRGEEGRLISLSDGATIPEDAPGSPTKRKARFAGPSAWSFSLSSSRLLSAPAGRPGAAPEAGLGQEHWAYSSGPLGCGGGSTPTARPATRARDSGPWQGADRERGLTGKPIARRCWEEASGPLRLLCGTRPRIQVGRFRTEAEAWSRQGPSPSKAPKRATVGGRRSRRSGFRRPGQPEEWARAGRRPRPGGEAGGGRAGRRSASLGGATPGRLEASWLQFANLGCRCQEVNFFLASFHRTSWQLLVKSSVPIDHDFPKIYLLRESCPPLTWQLWGKHC